MRLAVTLRLRRASSSSGVGRLAGSFADRLERTRLGREAWALRHLIRRSRVSFSHSMVPSSGSTKASKVYFALAERLGLFSVRISSR